MYYDSPQVTVSDARITISGTDYPVRNVAAVGVEKKEPSRGCALFALIIGGLSATCGGVSCLEDSREGMWPLLLIGFLALGLGVLSLVMTRPTYTLIFQTNAGKVAAYTSKDEEEMFRIKVAINQSIDNLGR